MNCTCGCTLVILRYGVERCADCGRCTGKDAFVPIGEPIAARTTVSEPFEYRGHTVTPTDRTTRDGRPLYAISGPYVNERVCVGNERHRIDSGIKRNSPKFLASYGRR